jgi:hypothetical protein
MLLSLRLLLLLVNTAGASISCILAARDAVEEIAVMAGAVKVEIGGGSRVVAEGGSGGRGKGATVARELTAGR